MAVTRETELVLEGLDESDAREVIRAALRGRRDLTAVRESPTGFTLCHSPRNPLILETHFSLDLNSTEQGTRVRVMAKSPEWVTGDIFRMYPRLLARMKSDIETSYRSGARDESELPPLMESEPEGRLTLPRVLFVFLVVDLIAVAAAGVLGSWALVLTALVAGALIMGVAADRRHRRNGGQPVPLD
jgi:hypothetical protein